MYVAVLEIVLSLPQRVQLNVVGKQLCALFLFLLFVVIFQANKAIEYSGILQAAVAMRGGRIQIVRVKSSRSLLVLLTKPAAPFAQSPLLCLALYFTIRVSYSLEYKCR